MARHPAWPGDPGPSRAAGDRPASGPAGCRDRKSTRLNSSHLVISYAVFCLKKKKNDVIPDTEDERLAIVPAMGDNRAQIFPHAIPRVDEMIVLATEPCGRHPHVYIQWSCR